MNAKQRLDRACLALCRQIIMLRDGHKCRVCKRAATDTIHIFDRDIKMLRYDIHNLYAGCRVHHDHDYPYELKAQHIEVVGWAEWLRLEALSKEYKCWREIDLKDLKVTLTEVLNFYEKERDVNL